MIAVIDFETTGLLVPGAAAERQPGIVQIGALILDPSTLKENRCLSMLIDPEKHEADWSKKAIEVHGITPEVVKNEATLFSVFDQFTDFILGCRVWGGYNTPFDINVLKYQLQRYGLETSFPWPPKELDVMKIARDHFQEKGRRGLKFIKLTDAYERLFHETFDAHDALADCRATAAVLRKLKGSI